MNVWHIISHQKKAFSDLKSILNINKNCKIVIAGICDESTKEWKHTLGQGKGSIAFTNWQNNPLQPDKPTNPHYIHMITNLVNDLLYNKPYNDRVSLGNVGKSSLEKCKEYTAREKLGFEGDPSHDLIHVWGAHSKNYNIKHNNKYVNNEDKVMPLFWSWSSGMF